MGCTLSQGIVFCQLTPVTTAVLVGWLLLVGWVLGGVAGGRW